MIEQTPPITPPPAPVSDKKGFAIAGLVLGILNLCSWFLPICGAPMAVIGIVLSALGLKSTGKGMAIAGIILSAIGLLLAIINAILGAVVGSGDIFQQIQSQLGTTY